MKHGGAILSLLGVGVGTGVAAYFLTRDDMPQRPMEGARSEPTLPTTPSVIGRPSTGYKRVNAILDKLAAAADRTGIPLGLMVGWVAKESGGDLASHTSLDERGYFQLMPSESKALGLDHQRLSTDSDYSIDPGGTAIVLKYAADADKLGIAPHGSSYFWRLTKLLHSMGSGAVKKIAKAATAAGATGSWDAFEGYALANNAALLSATKHAPAKWFPFVDAVYKVGAPFGFGSDAVNVVGGDCAGDALNPLDALSRMLASERPRGSLNELQAAAWAVRNRARLLGRTIGGLLAPTGEYGPQDDKRPFASTTKPASDTARAVAAAVLSQPDSADPTGGAVDFWDPSQHARLKALGDLYRSGKQTLVGYAGYRSSESDVRADYARRGLKVVGVVGEIELLG